MEHPHGRPVLRSHRDQSGGLSARRGNHAPDHGTQAALAGLPIVLVDHTLSEVLEPGVNGVYAENSAESIAEAVIDLFSHPKKRQEYGEASQRLARRFTEKRQVAKLAKLYEQVVAEHHKK